MTSGYIKTSEPNGHIGRKKAISAAHPSVVELMGQNNWSALWIIFCVGSQFAIAYALNDSHWAVMLFAAYFVGAFFNHALYVLIHECCHNLVFKTRTPNKVMGLICDWALVIPSAMAFRKYHMMHHRYLGEYHGDPDIVAHWEAKLVGNSWWKKTLWLFFFSISQAFRPSKMSKVPFWNKWIVANLIQQALVNVALFYLLGGGALVYLGLSTLFALGLHPLGGRWIQEHYVTEDGQETYSYYGPLNNLTFNMGYHNEHHDFMNVPWNNLPKLKKLAPEYYDNLASYQSWTWVLLNFIFNKEMSSYKRIVHPDRLPAYIN